MKKETVIVLIVVGIILLIVIFFIAKNLTKTTTTTGGGATTTTTAGIGGFLTNIIGGIFTPKDPCDKPERQCDPNKKGWNVSGLPDMCCDFG